VADANTFSNYLLTTQPIQFPGTGTFWLTFNMKRATQVGNLACPDGFRIVSSSDKFLTM
jgi:hypothetical protein